MQRRTYYLKFLSLTLCLFFSTASFSWELEYDKDGIQIFTQTIEGSSFKAFRGTVTADTHLLNVMAHHADLEAMTEWLQDCQKSELLSQHEGTHFYIYQQTSAPWPVSDRDYVLHMQIDQDQLNFVITINFEATQAVKKADKDCVPITELRGYWRFTPIETNKVFIEYQTSADPAGDIPAWLANSFVIDQPLGTLKKLKQRVESKEYTLPAALSYIKAPE